MVKKQTKKAKTTRLASGHSPRTIDDFKTAALVVSLAINVAIFIGWLAVKLTTDYDAQVYSFFFDR